MPTPADELKAAAEKLRASSSSATEAPWAIWRDLDHQGFITVGDAAGVLSPERPYTEDCNPVAHVYTEEDATYIAAMHPSVGAALADWLDETATEVTAAEGTEYELLAHEPDNSWTAALAVARQILGTAP